jgi:hypothetical protein
MRFRTKLALVLIAAGALVPAWGYWYSLKHASLHLRVDDYSLQSSTQSYGVPHNVTLTLRDESNAQLAIARSVEPLGYILAVHPNSDIGNCEHREMDTATTQEYQRNYAACYEQYSAWSATWASRVHSADITVRPCEMRGVPVTVHLSSNEWLLWWVPLPHVGGLPRQHFEFSVAIDSRACAPVTQLSASMSARGHR